MAAFDRTASRFAGDAVAKKEIIVSFADDQSWQEKWADRFAMVLLMPEKAVREEHAKMVIPLSKTLAEKFQVPKDVMKRRLDRLELIYID